MHEFFSREPDSIESMLRPPSPSNNEPLRQSVYAQTQRVLRRRHRLRRFAYAASLLLSFAAGVGTMRMIAPQPVPIVESPGPSANKIESQFPDNPAPSPDDSASARELIAFDSADRRSELYRQAGDHYIKDENDLQSALRCYGNALDSGSEQDLAISSEDNWLLMAIKVARQKEKNHAKQGG